MAELADAHGSGPCAERHEGSTPSRRTTNMKHTLITVIITILSGSLRIVKLVLSLIATIILLSTITFIGIYFYFARGLPDIRSLEDYKPPVLSQVYAGDGTVIGEFWTECRIFIPYEEIPKKVIQAFVASEDTRFFEHKGVDMRSIVRAFLANLKAGEITQGGSTITQQITRSILLSRERTFTRKIKEAILATRLERQLDKEQILTLYLNQIFLGNRSYGIASAARNYFHKDTDQLNLAEIALLAGLPSAPTRFSPINNSNDAREQQKHVLNRMLDEKLIAEQEKEQALGQTLTIYAAGIDKDFSAPENAYFVEHVRRLVKDKYGDDVLYHKGLKIYTTMDMAKQKAAYLALRHGIETITKRQGWMGPIDHIPAKDMHKLAEHIEKKILRNQRKGKIIWPPENAQEPSRVIVFDKEKHYRAIVTGFRGRETLVAVGNVHGVIPLKGIEWARPFNNNRYNYYGGRFISNPHRILKIGDVINVKHIQGNEFELFQEPQVQGAIFSMDPHTAGVVAMVGGYNFDTSEFNRATQALRQPGSSFKPFVYASALDKGYTYNTTIMDTPVQYVVGRRSFWSPRNYGGGYKGPTPFQNCIKFSRNVPTVKIVADIGTHYLTAYQRKLGITTLIDKYLSMALGANVVSLSEIIPAYVTFVNHGIYKAPVYINKIIDSKGNVLEEHKALIIKPAEVKTQNKVIDPQDVEFNTTLYEVNKPWIEKDGLALSELELKTLYGNAIPKGHVITPQTAYLMVRLMRGVVTGGTGTRVNALGKPVAGKTGTTNDETDTWFVGFVPDLAAGVWIGFDEIKPIGRGEQGGRTSAPIFLEYMKEATKDFEPKEFEPPKGFPTGRIASLPGGSAVFGALYSLENIGGPWGVDRAGEFFEEDMESYGMDEAPPAYSEPVIREAPNYREESMEEFE